MLQPTAPAERRAAFEALRSAVATRHRGAAPEAFALAEDEIVCSGLGELDAALGGGFPRGAISTLEGAPGSGRSAVAARLLATATANGGLAAIVELERDVEGAWYPPALAAAGVDLDRLLIVRAQDGAGAARAIDILARAAAFGVIVMPTLGLRAAAWTRLASLTHRANAVLVALGAVAPEELRYFASLRVRVRASDARFAGEPGPFCAFAGFGVEAVVLKHKRAAPGRRAQFACETFERAGPPLAALRVREIAPPLEFARRERAVS